MKMIDTKLRIKKYNEVSETSIRYDESGSLIVAIIVIFVTMLMSLVLIADIMETQDIAINGKHLSSSVQQSNAAISDAFYQLNQFGSPNSQDSMQLTNLPASFCAYAGNLYSNDIPNNCIYEGTVTSGGHSGWVYIATLQPTAVQTESLKTYLINATGYSPSGSSKQAQEYDQIAIINAALAMPAGFVINGGASIYPTNSSGVIQDQAPSVSVNEGAASCGTITFPDGSGYVNVYGKSASTTSGCQGSLTGTPMLNQQPAQNQLCTAVTISTIPATGCLPPITTNSAGQVTNYAPGCTPPSPESYSCCPTDGVFTGEVNPGIYLCNAPISIDAPLYDNNGGSCTQADNTSAQNGGKITIYDFIPQAIAAGSQDVTFGNSGSGDGINQYPVPSSGCSGTPVSGDANNLQINISNPGNPTGLCNSSNYTSGDFGNIQSADHGSNVPAIVAELDAPNDTFNINGAPFTSWTGNMYTCFADFNGGGNGKMVINDNVDYAQMTSPWSGYGYQDT